MTSSVGFKRTLIMECAIFVLHRNIFTKSMVKGCV